MITPDQILEALEMTMAAERLQQKVGGSLTFTIDVMDLVAVAAVLQLTVGAPSLPKPLVESCNQFIKGAKILVKDEPLLVKLIEVPIKK